MFICLYGRCRPFLVLFQVLKSLNNFLSCDTDVLLYTFCDSIQGSTVQRPLQLCRRNKDKGVLFIYLHCLAGHEIIRWYIIYFLFLKTRNVQLCSATAVKLSRKAGSLSLLKMCWFEFYASSHDAPTKGISSGAVAGPMRFLPATGARGCKCTSLLLCDSKSWRHDVSWWLMDETPPLVLFVQEVSVRVLKPNS